MALTTKQYRQTIWPLFAAALINIIPVHYLQTRGLSAQVLHWSGLSMRELIEYDEEFGAKPVKKT